MQQDFISNNQHSIKYFITKSESNVLHRAPQCVNV